MKRIACLAVAVLALSAIAYAADLSSGLPVGESVPAFNVRDITGPDKGKTLCLRCKYGSRPVVTVFTQKVDENITDLAKQVDGLVAKNKDAKMASFFVVLTTEPDSTETKLAKVAVDQKIENVPLTLIEGAGPANYKLNKDAEVTVMMWVGGEVKYNHAFAKGEFNAKAIPGILAETGKILK